MGLFLGDSEPSKIFVGDTQISKVFLGDTQIRPSGGGGWQPGENLLSYYPLDGDILDHKGDYGASGQALDLSVYTGSISYGTLTSGKKYGTFNGSTILNRNITTTYPQTIMCWAKGNITQSSFRGIVGNNGVGLIFRRGSSNSIGFYDWGLGTYRSTGVALSTSSWQHIAMNMNGTTATMYINGVAYGPYNNSYSPQSGESLAGFWVGSGYQKTDQAFNGYISEIYCWTREVSNTEILDYINETKANYGIS